MFGPYSNIGQYICTQATCLEHEGHLHWVHRPLHHWSCLSKDWVNVSKCICGLYHVVGEELGLIYFSLGLINILVTSTCSVHLCFFWKEEYPQNTGPIAHRPSTDNCFMIKSHSQTSPLESSIFHWADGENVSLRPHLLLFFLIFVLEENVVPRHR